MMIGDISTFDNYRNLKKPMGFRLLEIPAGSFVSKLYARIA